jgi:uncharacterized membrane protein
LFFVRFVVNPDLKEQIVGNDPCPVARRPPAIRINETALIAALALGLVRLTASKGTIPNRLVGWSWVRW